MPQPPRRGPVPPVGIETVRSRSYTGGPRFRSRRLDPGRGEDALGQERQIELNRPGRPGTNASSSRGSLREARPDRLVDFVAAAPAADRSPRGRATSRRRRRRRARFDHTRRESSPAGMDRSYERALVRRDESGHNPRSRCPRSRPEPGHDRIGGDGHRSRRRLALGDAVDRHAVHLFREGAASGAGCRAGRSRARYRARRRADHARRGGAAPTRRPLLVKVGDPLEEVVGQPRVEDESAPVDRMFEAQMRRVEGRATESRRSPRPTVNGVSDKRQAGEREMHADLMGPTGFGPDLGSLVIARGNRRSTRQFVIEALPLFVSTDMRLRSRGWRPIGRSMRPSSAPGRPRTSVR